MTDAQWGCGIGVRRNAVRPVMALRRMQRAITGLWALRWGYMPFQSPVTGVSVEMPKAVDWLVVPEVTELSR